LTIGLLIDAESSRRLVDHGPPASDTQKATAFRTFWGEKAELRRFKDGSILESVVWNCKTTEDRYAIVKRIVRYVIARHISAGVAGDIHFLTLSLYPELSTPSTITGTFLKTEGDAFQGLSEVFEKFVKELKDLKDVPLGISGAIPVGEGLTQTSVWSPYPQNYNKLSGQQQAGEYYIPVQEVVLQFEGSGKWPDDLKAIQKVKIGFLLHIARQLETTYSVSANIGLENEDLDVANQGFMDVVYESGYTFRVRIQHDPNHREATLLERILKNKALSHGDRTKCEKALKCYQNTFMRGTAHAQALHALRGKYYFLPNTIRLVKRWIAAHMLSPQISSRAIELIVCYIFCHPHPWSSPASAEVGFLRTLKLLSTWDWRKEPLIVDLDGSMTSARYEEINKEFEGVRKQDPGIAHAAWSIYCAYDTSGSCWTRESPGKAVAARVTALAKSSLEVLSKDSGNVKQIFTTPLTDYDFLIHLKTDYSTSANGSVFKNLQGQGWKDVLVDFDPVKGFLKDLEVLLHSKKVADVSYVSAIRFCGSMIRKMGLLLPDCGIPMLLRLGHGKSLWVTPLYPLQTRLKTMYHPCSCNLTRRNRLSC
jgi:U3 small nucleolar RNA-associated protein 22